jgi:hypothetical protein
MSRTLPALLLLALLSSACDRPEPAKFPDSGPLPLQTAPAEEIPVEPRPMPALDAALSERLTGLALRCVDVEYPNKLGQVLDGDAALLPPRVLHPAFFGCFDWHSAVHGHWALVRQLRTFPEHPQAEAMRAALRSHLSPENLVVERDYFRRPFSRTFERPYGMAWLLSLSAELRGWDDDDGRAMAAAMLPLEEEVIGLLTAFLPLQNHPVRVGTHTNTAYALAHAWDFAEVAGNDALRQQIQSRARDYYLADVACPLAYEPSGTDFLSPCLEEADLMRRVLPVEEFVPWLEAFLPDPAGDAFAPMRRPVEVLDLSDPYLVHLVGLNLSRAHCLQGIASALPGDHPWRPHLLDVAALHLEAGLADTFTDDYGGEHWLATFALRALTGP